MLKMKHFVVMKHIRLLILIQLNVSRFFLFIGVQVPTLRLLLPCVVFFGFKAQFFQSKINKPTRLKF